MICHVALCTPPYSTLTYLTPAEFPGFDWKPGLRVAVPLGNGAIRVGVVTAVFEEDDARAMESAIAGLKVLAKGEIKTAVNVVADKWSKSAEAAIVKAGGTIKNN